jgi:sec-independent protein translocase protein TatA
MIGSLGLPEVLLIFVVFLLVFGVNKLPLLGKGVGEGIRNFKKAMRDEPEPARSDKKEK